MSQDHGDSAEDRNALLDVPEDALAVVGMAGRFPGAAGVAEFWENIKNGVESISMLEEHELEIPPNPDSPDATPTYVPAKGLLDGVDLFDARYFGYLPKEAALMDPQHRVFLENCVEALEHAGYDPARYPGAIGVYAGCYIDTYLLSNLCTDPAFLHRLVESIQVGTLQTELGNDKDYLATRVSFNLDLRGPGVTVQTACSTSLVAIAHACQSVASYQCDMALAGGVTITFPQKKGYYYKEGGMLSADGHCRPFDARAAGTVFSNASAVVLIKRAREAIADGDTIYALIRGFATNNDGGQKMSYTAPSVDGQAEVIALAQAVADVNPRTIGLVECHGTATPLGDPIEIAGLTKAFRSGTEDNQFCAVGSFKSNIGHLDCASGAAGLIKTALALRDAVLPPSLHYTAPNPKIDFERTPFYVNAELRDWKPDDTHPRRAGVSSFGVGGTNAHVVLEEAPSLPRSEPSSRSQHLFVISAKTETALAGQAERLASHLEAHADRLQAGDADRLEDVEYTLQVGRTEHEHRRFVVGSDAASAAASLRAKGPRDHSARVSKQGAPIVFMFPGQGAQHPNMGRELYEGEPVYREHFDACADILLPHLGRDLRKLLFTSPEDEARAAKALTETTVAQPAIFAVEYSLARLWMHWGIQPEALVGHSVGELAAACLAGVFSLEDALAIVTERGRLMYEQPRGTMLSIRLPVDEVRRRLTSSSMGGASDVALAAHNGPDLCVVSGPTSAIDALSASLERDGVPFSRLHTSHAFHSSMMDTAVAPTVARVAQAQLAPPSIPILSTVTGAWLSDEEARDASYWGRNLRETVRFVDAITALSDDPNRFYLEVGPGQTLSTLAKQTLTSCNLEGRCAPIATASSLSHAQRRTSDLANMLAGLGRLWLAGVAVDWAAHHGAPRRRVPLPTYAFDRKRHWVEPTPLDAPRPLGASAGAASGEGTPPASGADDETERLIQQQLLIMAQQLALFRSS